MVEYVHTADVHSLSGARKGLAYLLDGRSPRSLLDVGCGNGTWMRAAVEHGVETVVGVDGVADARPLAGLDGAAFHHFDLTQPLDLGHKFDLVISLEVAEHLPPAHAATFVASLARHGDLIFFSAACPGQHGQHHVNCQWPSYWQDLFNAEGFVCTDEIRRRMWSDPEVEPWYRQNIFACHRDPERAGREPRLNAQIHPDMVAYLHLIPSADIEDAKLPLSWYLRTSAAAIRRKLGRAFR